MLEKPTQIFFFLISLKRVRRKNYQLLEAYLRSVSSKLWKNLAHAELIHSQSNFLFFQRRDSRSK